MLFPARFLARVADFERSHRFAQLCIYDYERISSTNMGRAEGDGYGRRVCNRSKRR